MSDDTPVCGLVLPISAIEDCSEAHWSEVQDILTQAINSVGFEANVVSDSDDVGVIQKRIIQNLYDNPVVVVDVSAKNPNVMFEFGMRLAFDKPTIVVKDDQTMYSFDTSAIEHIEYPRDLRFSQIVDFKEKLAAKIKATYDRSQTDDNYTTFLKHFGEFKVAKIEEKEVSGQEYILDELRHLRRTVSRLERSNYRPLGHGVTKRERSYGIGVGIDICLEGIDEKEVAEMVDLAASHPRVISAESDERGKGHYHIVGRAQDAEAVQEVQDVLANMRRGKSPPKTVRRRKKS